MLLSCFDFGNVASTTRCVGLSQIRSCENSGLQPLAACARRPTLGVRAAPAMPIKLAKTRKQTKLKFRDLTSLSLSLTFLHATRKGQSQMSRLLASVLLVSLSVFYPVDVRRAGA